MTRSARSKGEEEVQKTQVKKEGNTMKTKEKKARTLVVEGKTVPVIQWAISMRDAHGKTWTCGPWDLALTQRVQKGTAYRRVMVTLYEKPVIMNAVDVA